MSWTGAQICCWGGTRFTETGPVNRTQMAQGSLAGRDNFSSVRPAVAPPIMHRSPVPVEQRNSPPTSQGGSLGLAREKTNLNILGLPLHDVLSLNLPSDAARALPVLGFLFSLPAGEAVRLVS